MSFQHGTAELIKNTSTVSPTTLPTVRDALSNLNTRTPTSLPVPISEGGTGETSKTPAFDALAPTTTAGDTIYHNGTDNIRLAIGAANTIYQSTGSAPNWVTVATALLALLTTRGDLITRDASAVIRLALGAADTFLGSNGTDPSWRTAAQVLASLGIVIGSFTPDMAFATPGTSSFSYASRDGRYLKVSNFYVVFARMEVTPTIGTGSGVVRLGGLPATAGNTGMGWVTESSSAFTWPAGRTQLTYQISNGTIYGSLFGLGSGGSGAALTTANLTGGAAHDIRYGGVYIS